MRNITPPGGGGGDARDVTRRRQGFILMAMFLGCTEFNQSDHLDVPEVPKHTNPTEHEKNYKRSNIRFL